MQKNIFLLGLIIFFGLFGLIVGNKANAQMGTQCYTGSWVQPTCNPVTSDPSSCNILPPLFSGAACDQHTGYLRIQNEGSAADTSAWTQLYPGKIMVGSVTGGYVVPNGGIEVYGPIVSGNFTAGSPPPTGYNSQGDIASAYDIYAGGALRITGSSSFYGTINAYNRATVIASVTNGNLLQVVNTAGAGSNATSLYVSQSSGNTGRVLDLITADGNNVYFDYLGYLNAIKDFQIRIDSDNNFTQNYFRINNGDNATAFQVDESGNAQISGDVSVAKNLSAGAIVANNPSAGRGKIWGNFTDLNNNNCTADQLLVYRGAPFTPGWYCVSTTNVGTTTVGNLLQTLQAGADASAFEGPVSIGTDSNGFTLVGPQRFVSGPANFIIKNRENVNLNNQLMGAIYFSDAYNFISQAKIEVARGAAGSGGDYPTKMSFWTTPDGSTVAQERLTILANGNVGIGNTFPNSKLNINVPVNTEGIKIVNNNYSPLVIRNSADVFDLFRVNEIGNVTANGTIRGRFTDGDGNLCANNQILVYNSGTSKWVCSASIPGGSQDLLSVLNVGSDASSFTGDVIVGGNFGVSYTNRILYPLHVYKRGAPAALVLESEDENSFIELRNADSRQIPYIDFTNDWSSGNTPDYRGRIAYWSDNDFQIIQATNNPLSFWTNNTKRMTITGSGSVGINTTNPGSKLEVNGGGSSVVSSILSGGVASYAVLATGRTSIENYIGTSQGINGLSLGAVAGDLVIRTQNKNMLFNINAGSNPAMYIKYNTLGGFVGIGTITPTTKLTVTPNANVEGVRIISSNYSPFVIRDSTDAIDYFRIRENGVVEGNPLNLKSTSYINFMTDNESIVKASISTVNGESFFKSDKIEATSIHHKETILQASQVTLYFKSNCQGCGGGGSGARNIDTGLLERLAKYANYIFAIPSVSALPICYSNCSPTDAPLCSTLGTEWYEVSRVYPYTFTENVLGCSSIPPDYCQNNTQSWPNLVYSRTCRKDSGGEALYTKIEFAGSPAGGVPGVTKVKDNLVVEQNLWGDGVTTGCEWVDDGINPKYCPQGKYVAGFDTTGSKIYCCDL